MMLSERNTMQLQLFPKSLPFLIYMSICVNSHLPGRPWVLYLLLLIAFFSGYCSEVIKILRLRLLQVCRKIVIVQKQFRILMIIRPRYIIEELRCFHWIWRPMLMLNTRGLHMTAIPRNGGVSCDISLTRLHFLEWLPCVYGGCVRCLCTTLAQLDEDVCSKVSVGCVNTVTLDPRDQLVLGTAWLHVRVGWNNPPNPICSCFVPPLLAAGCRNSAHVTAVGGWQGSDVGRWLTPGSKNRTFRSLRSLNFPTFFFFLNLLLFKTDLLLS